MQKKTPVNQSSGFLPEGLILTLNDVPPEREVKTNETDDDISINRLGWRSDNNQFVLNRYESGAFRLFWGGVIQEAYPAYVIFNNGTIVKLAGAASDVMGAGLMPQEILGAGGAVIDEIVLNKPNQMLPLGFAGAGYIGMLDSTVTATTATDEHGLTQADIQILSSAISGLLEDNAQTNTSSEVDEIVHWYAEKVSQIPEVERVRYKQRKKSIEFLVVVNRIRGGISRQLSQIESRLCDEYTNWFFEFEHIGSRTFSRQSRSGYANLFNRD